MINYNNSVIYKIYCKDENIKDTYIGSTTNFERRIREHKSRYNCNYDKKLYNFIKENGGFNNWDIKIICEKNLNNKKELHKIEREYIKNIKPSLNILLPYTTKEEKQQKLKISRSLYIKKKYTCICGSHTLIVNKLQHERTIKHKTFLEKL